HVYDARITFFQSLRVAINTFNTIMFICADVPNDPGRRKVYSLSLPPLTRTLFEQLIAFRFLMEDIPTYIPWLFKTGYTEHRIELKHSLKYHSSDPNWTSYIKHLNRQLSIEEKAMKLKADEIRNPRKNIGRWPTPGQMLDKLRKEHPTSSAIDFIEYINSWLYRELSGQTHLNVSGLTNRGIHFSIDDAKMLFGDDWEEKRNEQLEIYRQKQVWIAITIMLAIISEIEAHFNYELNQRARYLWTLLIEYSDIAKDFWEKRYSTLLNE
ncbi:MAG TPA: hypothetical protein VE732_08275, partial [Nitrososphaera sp.]|nr:hypothetical protein [Nitrososphaera sp.]